MYLGHKNISVLCSSIKNFFFLENVSSLEANLVQMKKPVCTRMCYTSLNSHEFAETIDSAYNYASDTLLNLLMNEYDILNRLK